MFDLNPVQNCSVWYTHSLNVHIVVHIPLYLLGI